MNTITVHSMEAISGRYFNVSNAHGLELQPNQSPERLYQIRVNGYSLGDLILENNGHTIRHALDRFSQSCQWFPKEYDFQVEDKDMYSIISVTPVGHWNNPLLKPVETNLGKSVVKRIKRFNKRKK